MKHFCIAYLDTVSHDAMAQAVTVAKYDLAIVALMSNMSIITPWLDKARLINPNLKLIGYVQAAAEDLTPSIPGAIQRKAHPNAWLQGTKSPGGGRYADFRSSSWQDTFQSACEATRMAYPIDGLFFDDCAVWAGHVRLTGDGPRMAEGLQAAISEQRRRHPSSILIGNTSDKWTDLNGELNESRPPTYPFELQSSPRHADPEMKLAHVYTDDPLWVETYQNSAAQYGAWFGASPDPQHVKWYDCFDSVVGNGK